MSSRSRRSDPRTRFTAVDLGHQLGALDDRKFAIWDHVVSRFWKIRGHQTWERISDLIADFDAVWPDDVKFHEVHRTQRDVLAEKAFALGFPTGEES